MYQMPSNEDNGGVETASHADRVDSPLLESSRTSARHRWLNGISFGMQAAVNFFSTSMITGLMVATNADSVIKKFINLAPKFTLNPASWISGIVVGGVFGYVEANAHYLEAKNITNESERRAVSDNELSNKQKLTIAIAWMSESLNDANDFSVFCQAFLPLMQVELDTTRQVSSYLLSGCLGGLGNIQEARNTILAYKNENEEDNVVLPASSTTKILIAAQYLKNFIKGSKTGYFGYFAANFIADVLKLDGEIAGIQAAGLIAGVMTGMLAGLATASVGEVVRDFVFHSAHRGDASLSCWQEVRALLHFAANVFNDAAAISLMLDCVFEFSGIDNSYSSLPKLGSNLLLFSVMAAGNTAQLLKDRINNRNNLGY